MRNSIIAFALAMAIVPGGAYGQELPKYRIRNAGERMLYDYLATRWDDETTTVRQCALDRLKEKHITRNYENLAEAFNSCFQKELDEQ